MKFRGKVTAALAVVIAVSLFALVSCGAKNDAEINGVQKRCLTGIRDDEKEQIRNDHRNEPDDYRRSAPAEA